MLNCLLRGIYEKCRISVQKGESILLKKTAIIPFTGLKCCFSDEIQTIKMLPLKRARQKWFRP